ncbi:MAG TPA: DUF1761 domain-containing protein [Acidobacteriaceae bacterium]|nr:DUF1761 domain-containing protein [Acidobacteriaceae bacterium]
MLFLLWLVLCLVGLFLILLPLALWRHEIYKRYSGSRLVACPENQRAAAVSIDARHAAATGVHGRPDLRLCDCTRWPERAQCARGCLSQAVQAEPYEEGKAGTKPIHHLPIVLAAFAAWCLGAVWHSRFLFRTQWMDAVGLTRTQVRQIRWWYSPHLLTVGVWLLFAYGVAWLLTVCHRKGVLQGVLMAVLLCGALVAASWYGLAGLPHDLLAIEAGYTVLAALTVGAIVGGLYDKLVLPSP